MTVIVPPGCKCVEFAIFAVIPWFEAEEPTKFIFTKIVETNAKMRRRAIYKNVYKYEVEGQITLNDNNHKENLFRKICSPQIGTRYVDFAAMGID